MVAYDRCLLTRGSKYSYLTWKHLAFWTTGCQREVVAIRGLTVVCFNISEFCKLNVNVNVVQIIEVGFAMPSLFDFK